MRRSSGYKKQRELTASWCKLA